MDRAGLRRKLLKAQAEAGDIVLLFADESEALTCLVAERSWDQVRWAIEESAWRFDGCAKPSQPEPSQLRKS